MRFFLRVLVMALGIFCLLPNTAIAKCAVSEKELEQPSEPKNCHVYRSWMPSDRSESGVLLCVHGFGLTGDAYTTLAKKLASKGFTVYAVKVRGFGGDSDARGCTAVDPAGTVVDMAEVIEQVKQEHPSAPIFLLGESMGGAIALQSAERYKEQIAGLILSAPAARRFKGNREAAKVFLHSLAGPNRNYDEGSNLIRQASSQDSALAKTWESDKRNRKLFSPLDLARFQLFMNKNEPAAANLSGVPVLMIQGVEDSLVEPMSTWNLFLKIGSSDKTLLAIPYGHLVLEYERLLSKKDVELIAGAISSWISARSATTGN